MSLLEVKISSNYSKIADQISNFTQDGKKDDI
jgi:hypothetical protein